ITMDGVDRAVRRTLQLKFELGLFEKPYVEPSNAIATVDAQSQRELAARVAEKSIVLLRNDGLLLLAEAAGRIAVIGPNADNVRNMMGDYAYPAHIESLLEMRDRHNVFGIPISDDVALTKVPLEAQSLLDALRDRYGDSVAHAPGCEVSGDDTSGI